MQQSSRLHEGSIVYLNPLPGQRRQDSYCVYKTGEEHGVGGLLRKVMVDKDDELAQRC